MNKVCVADERILLQRVYGSWYMTIHPSTTHMQCICTEKVGLLCYVNILLPLCDALNTRYHMVVLLFSLSFSFFNFYLFRIVWIIMFVGMFEMRC
jgi:hypothetical protein